MHFDFCIFIWGSGGIAQLTVSDSAVKRKGLLSVSPPNRRGRRFDVLIKKRETKENLRFLGEWRNWQTRSLEEAVPFGVGVQVSPRPHFCLKMIKFYIGRVAQLARASH